MLRSAILAAFLPALAGCATADSVDRRALRPVGNPSEVITTELAFARAARDTGTWTAFRKFATKDAVWPGPQWENVQAALKDAKDPPQAIVWGPDLAWSSCDGTFALSTGPASYPDGRRTRFATIWQRQDDGEYRWVLDQGFDLEEGYAEREMIAGKVADCSPRASRPRSYEARRGQAWQSGRSDDGSLAWTTELAPDCRRTLVVAALENGAMTEVFRRVSSAPAVPPGTAAPSC